MSYDSVYKQIKLKFDEVISMELRKKILMKRAQEMYVGRKILPIASRGCFENCFTELHGRLIFWFNTEDNSSHLIAEERTEAV